MEVNFLGKRFAKVCKDFYCLLTDLSEVLKSKVIG